MNTDELVDFLATGAQSAERGSHAYHRLAGLAAGCVAALLLTAGVLGLHPRLLQEALLPMFWVREAFCVALGVAALACVARLVRPGAGLGLLPAALAAPVLVMWLLAAASLIVAAPQQRADLIFGQTANVCSILIALVSLPLFFAVIWAMRGYAPTQLRLAGAAGGFAAGALGALAYSLHCPELAAPFLGIWYVLGMLIPTVVGAAIGPRLLDW